MYYERSTGMDEGKKGKEKRSRVLTVGEMTTEGLDVEGCGRDRFAAKAE